MNLSTNFYIEGYNLAIENANSLFKIATKAAEENEFGVACSLNILSTEEAIKAVFLIVKHHYPDSQIEDFEEIFKDHKIKHKNLKYFLESSKQFVDDISKMYSLFLKVESLGNFLPAKRQEELREEFSDIHYHGQRITELKKNEIILAKTLNWLDNANTDKNNGLYIGKKKNVWLTPKSFTNKKYEKEKKYSEAIINHAVELNEILKAIEGYSTKNLR